MVPRVMLCGRKRFKGFDNKELDHTLAAFTAVDLYIIIYGLTFDEFPSNYVVNMCISLFSRNKRDILRGHFGISKMADRQ